MQCLVFLNLGLGYICREAPGHDGYHYSELGVGWSKYNQHSSDYAGPPDFSVEEALGG